MNQDYRIVTKPNLLKRVIACLVDYGIIAIFTAVMFKFYGEPNDEGGYSVNGLPAFAIMLFWFAVVVFTEQMNGRTIGNQLMKLRAVPKKDFNSSLTFGQSFGRHILDVVDFWFFGLVALILIKRSESNQRLGDFIANTIVIDETDPEQGLIDLNAGH